MWSLVFILYERIDDEHQAMVMMTVSESIFSQRQGPNRAVELIQALLDHARIKNLTQSKKS